MRIVVNNQGLLVLTHHEKEQDLSGEGGPGGDRAELFCEKTISQHSAGARMSGRKWAWT